MGGLFNPIYISGMVNLDELSVLSCTVNFKMLTVLEVLTGLVVVVYGVVVILGYSITGDVAGGERSFVEIAVGIVDSAKPNDRG